MNLEDLKIYALSIELGEKVWNIVEKWDYFQKDTIGKQLVRSADSVTANISEGFGRFHYKDSKNFNYYSRGSLYETKTWLTKANSRKMIKADEYQVLILDIEKLGKMLNSYIKTIGHVSKPETTYGFPNNQSLTSTD
jgi:four helix bundle protein